MLDCYEGEEKNKRTETEHRAEREKEKENEAQGRVRKKIGNQRRRFIYLLGSNTWARATIEPGWHLPLCNQDHRGGMNAQ